MTHHPFSITTLLALALAAPAAHAQHAVTMTLQGNDAAVFTVRSEGPVPVAAVELLAGSRLRDGATFTYTDIPPVPDAPTGALALAGLALITLRSRK